MTYISFIIGVIVFWSGVFAGASQDLSSNHGTLKLMGEVLLVIGCLAAIGAIIAILLHIG